MQLVTNASNTNQLIILSGLVQYKWWYSMSRLSVVYRWSNSDNNNSTSSSTSSRFGCNRNSSSSSNYCRGCNFGISSGMKSKQVHWNNKYDQNQGNIIQFNNPILQAMSRITVDQLQGLSQNAVMIRHMCIIANNVNHSQDLFIILFRHKIVIATNQRYYYYERPQQHGCGFYRQYNSKIKLVSLIYQEGIANEEMSKQTPIPKKYLIYAMKQNLPPLQSFNETIASLRICDGAIVIVGLDDNLSSSLKSIANQIIKYYVTPIIFIQISKLVNKKEKVNFQNLQEYLKTTITSIIAIFQQAKQLKQSESSPFEFNLGNIILGNLTQQWAFTFADIIKKRKNQKSQFIFSSFYYDMQLKKWKDRSQGKELQEQQAQKLKTDIIYIVNSLFKKISYLQNKNQLINEEYNEFQLQTPENIQKLNCQEIFKKIMSSNFQISGTLFKTITQKVPSPNQIQYLKVKSIYEGKQDEEIYQYISQCDPKGPLMIYITKSQFFSQENWNTVFKYGRIYSGSSSSSSGFRIYENQAKLNSKYHPKQRKLKLCSIYGRKFSHLQIFAGNLVIVKESYFSNSKAITITSSGCNLENFFVNLPDINQLPQKIVKISIAPKDPTNLPKMIEGMKRIKNYYSNVGSEIAETGLYYLNGTNLSAIKNVISQIQESAYQIKSSEPQLIFKQTVTSESTQMVMVKSPNKHNKLYGKASPLSQQLRQTLCYLNNYGIYELKEKVRFIEQKNFWNELENGKIWSFGPQKQQTNILSDCFTYSTKSQSYINQVKQSVKSAFYWASKEGVLCEQQMCGVNFSIVDCQLISDAIHRGGGQIIPTARRLFYASQLLANPIVLEPFYACKVKVYNKSIEDFNQMCSDLNIKIISEQESVNLGSFSHKVQIPVLSWKQNIYQYALIEQQIEIQWKQIQGSIYQNGSSANNMIKQIRERKGLNPNLPNVDNYRDKL